MRSMRPRRLFPELLKTLQDSSPLLVYREAPMVTAEHSQRHAVSLICRNVMPQRFVFICLQILVLAPAFGEEGTLQRWALLSTSDVRESGVADLLTSELSRQPEIELVERDRLQDVMRELQLTALVGPDQVGQRLQLGKTLRADALIVLSFVGRQDQKRLQMVVCDARLGVRIWRGSLAASDVDIEELVEQCVVTVSEVRQRFAGGVRHIVAVPPFLSTDFDQRFDYLQSRYSNLLASRMLAYGGVAAVEIDEARAVLRELDDTLSGGLVRPISTIVKGSYHVTPLYEDNRRQVEMSIELIGGQGTRETIRKTVDIRNAGEWLVQELAERLYAVSQKRSPSLSPKVQKEILARHAQRFAELGDWERSRPLREAALVLDPSDILQRGLVIREYQLSVQRDVGYTWFKNLPPVEEKEPELRRAAHDYTVGLDHLAYLVRNRSINRADAAGLFYKQRWLRPQGTAHPKAQEYFATMEPAVRAQRQFIRDVFPLINQLPGGRVLPAHLSDPFYGCNYIVTKHVADDVAFHGYSAESLASLEDLLTRVLPESTRTNDTLLGTFWHGSVYTKDAARERWMSLLEKLCSASHELARLHGRWGQLLATEVSSLRQAGMEELLGDLKRLEREDGALARQLQVTLTRTKNRLAAAQNPPQAPGKPWVYSADNYFSLGRVQLEPIAVRIEGEKASNRPLIKGMLKCGETCDAYWTSDRFFLMHEPGVLREIKLTNAKADHVLFWNATWDGECIWIHAQGVGIVAVRASGEHVATFRQNEHIPGYWKGFQLVGLSPRRALMTGSFGPSSRAWCAMLEVDEDGEQSADVFFEAKYVADGRAKEQADSDPRTAFQPDRMLRVRNEDGKTFVLVARRNRSGYLLIDPETRNVSVSKPTGLTTRTELGFRGRTFLLNGRSMATLAPTLQNADVRTYVFHDGWLYAPGRFWYRVHIESGREERLQPRNLRMPTELWNIRGGPSAHYGFVVHHLYRNSPPLYRVTIADADE